MAYEFNTLAVELADGVLEVVLNRPDVRNAINHEMETEIDAVLDEAEVDPDVRAVLVRGAGTLFSAGHDLNEWYSDPKLHATSFPFVSPSQSPCLPRAWYFRKPLIGAVHRYVGPAAMSLVACCDFNIAGEGTKFSCEIYRERGSRPTMAWLPLYVQLPMRAIEKLFLLGGWMDSEQALAFQFVQRIVPEDQVAAEGRRWAEQAALIDPHGFGHGKDQIRRSIELMGLASLPAALARFFPPRPRRDGEFSRVLNAQGLQEALNNRDAKFDSDVARV